MADVTIPALSKNEIAALRQARAAGTKGLRLYAHGPFFCTGQMGATKFRVLAGEGLLDVTGARIFISAAGLSFLDGVP